MRYLLTLLLTLSIVIPSTKAQPATPEAIEAVITSDNETPQLGEPFTLTLTATVPKTFQLKGWIKLPIRTFPLVIREQGELSITETPDNLTYTQTFRAVLWNTGLYVTPPLWLTYADALGDQQHPFNSVSMTVPSLLVDEVSPTLRPSFSPQALPYLSPLLPLGLTFTLLSTLGALWYVRWRRKTVTGRESTPIQLAKAQLEDVIHNDHEPSLSYALISQILREYVTAVFRVAATEMTTQELVDTLQAVEKIPRPLLHGLESLLSQADLVKFARFEAQTPTRYASQVLRWLQTVDLQYARKDETQ